MSWEILETKYGFKTKNKKEIFRKFNNNEITASELMKLNQNKKLSGEDLEKMILKISEQSLIRDII